MKYISPYKKKLGYSAILRTLIYFAENHRKENLVHFVQFQENNFGSTKPERLDKIYGLRTKPLKKKNYPGNFEL